MNTLDAILEDHITHGTKEFSRLLSEDRMYICGIYFNSLSAWHQQEIISESDRTNQLADYIKASLCGGATAEQKLGATLSELIYSYCERALIEKFNILKTAIDFEHQCRFGVGSLPEIHKPEFYPTF